MKINYPILFNCIIIFLIYISYNKDKLKYKVYNISTLMFFMIGFSYFIVRELNIQMLYGSLTIACIVDMSIDKIKKKKNNKNKL